MTGNPRCSTGMTWFPVQYWRDRLEGTATKAAGTLPARTPALAPPATKSAEHLAGSLGNPSLTRQHCLANVQGGAPPGVGSPRLAAMHQFSLE